MFEYCSRCWFISIGRHFLNGILGVPLYMCTWLDSCQFCKRAANCKSSSFTFSSCIRNLDTDMVYSVFTLQWKLIQGKNVKLKAFIYSLKVSISSATGNTKLSQNTWLYVPTTIGWHGTALIRPLVQENTLLTYYLAK